MMMRYWSGQDPIGHRLQANGRWLRIVGEASKYESMSETPKPFFCVPLRQDFVRQADFYIRTTESLPSTTAAVLREVHAFDQNLALYEMATLQEQVNRATSPQLAAVTMVSTLGGLALLLAAVGLYGVMSCAVAQSNRELGLRMALDANPINLLRLLLVRGLGLTMGGIFLGTVAALALTRLLGQLLYNVSPIRSCSIRTRLGNDGYHCYSRLSIAGVAGKPDRSGSRPAGLTARERLIVSCWN